MRSNDEEIGNRHASVAQSRTFRNLREALALSRLRVLDIGCGFGEYLAHFGAGSVGITTTKDEVVYGTHAGLDIRSGNAESLDPALGVFEAAWANNLFEHLLSPHAFLMTLKDVVAPDGQVIIGVPVVPAVPFLMRLRRFRGALASNHIGFYTSRTLRLTVERAGWKIAAVRPFLFRNAALDALFAPIAPHLYLVARNDPSFRYPSKKVREWEDDQRYARLLALGNAAP